MKALTMTPNEAITLEFEFARALESLWLPGTEYTLGQYVRPTVPNGFEYECTNAGQTDTEEPDWPTTIAQTINDGSVEWTARDMATNATDTISSQTVVSDATMTIGTPTRVGSVVSVRVSGPSGCHEVVCQIITAAGDTIEATKRVVISG